MRRIIIVIIGGAAIAAGVYWITKSSPTPPSPVNEAFPSLATSAPANASPRPTLPAGWAEYKNTHYGFSIYYPKSLAIKEYPQKNDTTTFVFQNSDVSNAEGFQIFVGPYYESRVSEERFKLDVPSGVREGLEDTTLDGTTAAKFYSSDLSLGDTYEIWVVHSRYLFELTTAKPLSGLLDTVAASWKFI